MHISLTETLESMVKSKVETGLYNNASEVVREALRLMHERDETEASRYAEFKRQVMLGYNQIQRGELATRTFDEIEADVEARHYGP